MSVSIYRYNVVKTVDLLLVNEGLCDRISGFASEIKISVHQDELSASPHGESDEMKCGCCLQGRLDMSFVCGQRRHHRGNMTGIA